jgi:hypothetical protein
LVIVGTSIEGASLAAAAERTAALLYRDAAQLFYELTLTLPSVAAQTTTERASIMSGGHFASMTRGYDPVNNAHRHLEMCNDSGHVGFGNPDGRSNRPHISSR